MERRRGHLQFHTFSGKFVYRWHLTIQGMKILPKVSTYTRREKGRDLTQSYDKSPYTDRKLQKASWKTPPKSSITQRVRTDLGRSVGLTAVNQTGVVKPGLRALTPPTHRKSSVINRTWHDRTIVYNTDYFEDGYMLKANQESNETLLYNQTISKSSSKNVKNYALKIQMHIRLYGSCGTYLGRSIAEVTDNIHAISVAKPVCQRSNFPLTATAV